MELARRVAEEITGWDKDVSITEICLLEYPFLELREKNTGQIFHASQIFPIFFKIPRSISPQLITLSREFLKLSSVESGRETYFPRHRS